MHGILINYLHGTSKWTIGTRHRVPIGVVSQFHRGGGLRALKRDQHVEVARTFLAKRDERLVLRRLVPSVQCRHVRELNYYDPLGLPVAALGKFVAAALGQIAATVLRKSSGPPDPVFLKLDRVCNLMFDN